MLWSKSRTWIMTDMEVEVRVNRKTFARFQLCSDSAWNLVLFWYLVIMSLKERGSKQSRCCLHTKTLPWNGCWTSPVVESLGLKKNVSETGCRKKCPQDWSVPKTPFLGGSGVAAIVLWFEIWKHRAVLPYFYSYYPPLASTSLRWGNKGKEQVKNKKKVSNVLTCIHFSLCW